jgi:outer membrane protein OmpA-like peptidoglycan-associated protein
MVGVIHSTDPLLFAMAKLVPTLFLAALAAGCASTTPPAAPPPAAPSTPTQRTQVAEALAVERQWLGSWFKDTPVKVAQRGDGAVSVEVPREFSFDAGKSSVKPALAAVLDKVAESLRRVPQAQVALVAAPDDGEVATALATQRAERIRDHLRSRGVAAGRLGRPSPAATATVQLRLTAAAPPVH